MYVYDLLSNNPANNSLSLLLQTSNGISRLMEAALSEVELTFAQLRLLWILRHHDRPLSVAELSRCVFRESQTVVTTVYILEKTGYVKKVNDPKDKRLVRIQITEGGSALLERSYRWIIPLMLEMTSDFSSDELQQLGEYLKRLREKVFWLCGTVLVEPMPGFVDMEEMADIKI